MPYYFNYKWKKKQLKKHNKSELIDTENKQLVTRGEVRLENEWNRWGWLTGTKIHLPKKKKSQGWNVQRGEYIQ